MENKKYGHFDDQHREYVITSPETPWPWINYLGNEDFFSLIIWWKFRNKNYTI